MTPADELRAAASKVRALASTATPGPWEMGGVGDFGWTVRMGPTSTETEDSEQGAIDAAYIAAMHPGVGTALATWLEHAADRLAIARTHPDWQEVAEPAALAVARLINPEQQ